MKEARRKGIIEGRKEGRLCVYFLIWKRLQRKKMMGVAVPQKRGKGG
jgi:hypothetical protein